jgi:hypothetical protein
MEPGKMIKYCLADKELNTREWEVHLKEHPHREKTMEDR